MQILGKKGESSIAFWGGFRRKPAVISDERHNFVSPPARVSQLGKKKEEARKKRARHSYRRTFMVRLFTTFIQQRSKVAQAPKDTRIFLHT